MATAAASLGQQAAQPHHRPVVMYHYPCPDGIFAALAAHLHFRDSGSDVRWVPNRVYAPGTVASLALQVSSSAPDSCGCHVDDTGNVLRMAVAAGYIVKSIPLMNITPGRLKPVLAIGQ